MGGDTNSGIMSGFEREKFFSGSGTGSGLDNTRRALDVRFPDVKSSEDIQPLADLITAAKQSGEATSVSQLPTMSQRQQALQDVQTVFGDVPPELKRGFGLSEYLALVKQTRC